MDLTDEQRDDYQQELDDLDEKQILIEIMVELKTIRYELQTEERRPNAKVREPQSESERYQCLQCREIVAEDERQKHLVEQHGAPAELSPEGEFSGL